MKKYSFLAFIILGCIWGSNFIYMKLSAQMIAPMQVVFYRALFGFVPVFLFAWYTRALKFEDLRYCYHFFVMSLLAAIVYFFGFVKGSFLLLSGVAGALSGAIPLFSFLLAAVFLKEEKITSYSFLGVIFGFLGVLLISQVFNENIMDSNIEGVLYVLLGSLSVGASFIYAKKFVIPLNIKPAALTTYQLGFAVVVLFFITDFEGIDNIWNSFGISVGLVIGLGVLGTGVAYIMYYHVIAQLGAIKASSITYIPPVVALIIGAVIIEEKIMLIDYLGTALIFVGVFLINKRNTQKQ